MPLLLQISHCRTAPTSIAVKNWQLQFGTEIKSWSFDEKNPLWLPEIPMWKFDLNLFSPWTLIHKSDPRQGLRQEPTVYCSIIAQFGNLTLNKIWDVLTSYLWIWNYSRTCKVVWTCWDKYRIPTDWSGNHSLTNTRHLHFLFNFKAKIWHQIVCGKFETTIAFDHFPSLF